MLGRTERLLDSVSALRDLAERLRALGYEALCRRLDEVAEAAFEPATRPLQRFYASEEGPDALALASLFRLRDPADHAEVARVLGEALVGALFESGLLVREGAQLRSAFELGAHGGFFFLSDDLSIGGDAVMGVGPYTLELFSCAEPQKSVRTALDLGCGAGVLSVLLAEKCERVIATDIQPRAIELTRVNAALNGITNIEARVGDLFAPVSSERFDLVLSQPPFVPHAEGADAAVYADGGSRGDELLQRLLRDLRRHLANRGRATIVAQLALGGDETSEARLRSSLGDLDALLFECPGPSLDAISIGNAAYHHPDLGEAFARESVARRAHFKRIGATRWTHLLMAIEPSKGRGRVVTVPLKSRFATVRIRDVDRTLARVAVAESAQLARAKLAIAPSVAFGETEEGVRVVFPPGAIESDTMISRDVHDMLRALDEHGTIDATAAEVARAHGVAKNAVLDDILPAARSALVRGILVVR